MAKYAENTRVSTTQSLEEIQQLISRFGASSFAYGYEDNRAFVMFEIQNRQVRFQLELPFLEEFAKSDAGRTRTADAKQTAWQQACKQKWRSLALAIKGKLVSVQDGVFTFEQEFLAHIVLPSNQTIGETILPDLDKVLASGNLPKLLPERND